MNASIMIKVLALATGAVVAAVALTVEPVAGLQPVVRTALADFGLEQPVTAVLLGFRSLDTLLEVNVLLLAVVAVYGLGPSSGMPEEDRPAGLMVDWLVPRLVPVLLLVGLYLWWAGSFKPGGAFQAGTVFGAAAALLVMAGRAPVQAESRGWRMLLALGPISFSLLAAMPVLTGDLLLQWPSGLEKPLVVSLELLLAFSIGASLLVLVGGAPRGAGGDIR